MESLKHSLWVEKYRPNKLDNYIGNDHLKSKVSVYLESGDIPHLLLFGRAGTGKTTLAKLLVNNIDCDYLYCLLYTSPSPRDRQKSRMPSSA